MSDQDVSLGQSIFEHITKDGNGSNRPYRDMSNTEIYCRCIEVFAAVISVMMQHGLNQYKVFDMANKILLDEKRKANPAVVKKIIDEFNGRKHIKINELDEDTQKEIRQALLNILNENICTNERGEGLSNG